MLHNDRLAQGWRLQRTGVLRTQQMFDTPMADSLDWV